MLRLPRQRRLAASAVLAESAQWAVPTGLRLRPPWRRPEASADGRACLMRPRFPDTAGSAASLDPLASGASAVLRESARLEGPAASVVSRDPPESGASEDLQALELSAALAASEVPAVRAV